MTQRITRSVALRTFVLLVCLAATASAARPCQDAWIALKRADIHMDMAARTLDRLEYALDAGWEDLARQQRTEALRHIELADGYLDRAKAGLAGCPRADRLAPELASAIDRGRRRLDELHARYRRLS